MTTKTMLLPFIILFIGWFYHDIKNMKRYRHPNPVTAFFSFLFKIWLFMVVVVAGGYHVLS